MRRIVLICAALLLAAESRAIEPGAPFVMQGDVLRGTCGPTPSVIGQYAGESIASCKAASFTTVAEDLQLNCDMSDDETATLRSAIEGGDAAGTSTFIRSGCRILLGTPGSGDSVAALPSGTTIYCEDATAGFVLATKHCSGASDAPGAACTADNQCNNGTCVADADAGTAFAPDAAETYTVFSAASGATTVAIRNCSIWAQGSSGNPVALGGSGKAWGYCDGAGTSVAGEACAKVCDATSSPGSLEGLACTSDAGCGSVAGSCDVIAGDCTGLGGACGSVPYTTNFAPVGPGKVNVIDFSNATGAIVDGVTVHDHRRGDFTIRTGAAATVENTHSDSRTLTVPIAGALLNFGINASVTKGLIASSGAFVQDSSASGWDASFDALGNNVLIGLTATALGTASESGWNGTTALLISGASVRAYGLISNGGLYCVLPKFGPGGTGGFNFLVQNPYCDGNIGPKFIVQGAGNQYLGIRGAWAGRGSVVGLGDQRGKCSGGTRSGKVCVFGAGTDSTIGCPSSSCAADDAYLADSAGHFVISGGGLLHTDQTGVSFIRATDSKRCSGGSDPGTPCTSDSDCNGGVSGQCRPLRFTDGLIDGVNFYNPTLNTNTAIELDTSSIGVHSNTVALGGGPSIENWLVDGLFRGFASGIEFPANSRVCVGGSSAGTSCTVDSTCTGGGGLCESPVKTFVASGNMANVTAPLANWDWTYGDVSGLKGLIATDDQGTVVMLTAGEALTRGQTVMVSTAAANTVLKTTTGLKEKAIGVVLATTLSGELAPVLTSGIGACIAQGSVTRGDLLMPSSSTAGSVATGTPSSSDLLFASALETTTTGNTFDCLIKAPPTIQNTTTVFPKFDYDQVTSPTGYAACSGTPTTLATITHTATSGKEIRLIGTAAHDVTASATRVATLSLRRGGSNCSTGSPTTLISNDTELKANENYTATIIYTDTGQSGSVTYRLCACADTGSSIEADNAALVLTEYTP